MHAEKAVRKVFARSRQNSTYTLVGTRSHSRLLEEITTGWHIPSRFTNRMDGRPASPIRRPSWRRGRSWMRWPQTRIIVEGRCAYNIMLLCSPAERMRDTQAVFYHSDSNPGLPVFRPSRRAADLRANAYFKPPHSFLICLRRQRRA